MTPTRMIQDGFMGLETAHKRYRARRRALGLCSAHGCKEKLVNKTHCETHRVIHNARMKEWMRKKKVATANDNHTKRIRND